MATMPEVEGMVSPGVQTCGNCKHWFKSPPDPNNLGQRQKGTCRESLRVVALPLGRPGAVQIQSLYPPVDVTNIACSHFEQRLQIAGN